MTPTFTRGGAIRIVYHARIKLTDPEAVRGDMTKEAWAAAVAALPSARVDATLAVPPGGYVLLGDGQRLRNSRGDYRIVTLLRAQRLPFDDAHLERVQLPRVEDSIAR
jgi:hypothetical protein